MRVQTPGGRFSLALFPFLGVVFALACGSGSPGVSTPLSAPEAAEPAGDARDAAEPAPLPSPLVGSTPEADAQESPQPSATTGEAPAVATTTPVVSPSPVPTTAPEQVDVPVSATPTPTAPVQTVKVGTRVGDRAPDFQVTTVDGQSVSLADLKGKPFILYFFASW